MAAPILDDNWRTVAVLILRTYPEKSLYPLIQSWPTPSGSAETLLVHRDGDDVLFLNKLRHLSDPAMTLRIPLTRSDVPAVQAAMGRTGIVQGIDYHGSKVVSDIRSVPGFPWFMVAKIDEREIFAEARSRGRAVLLLVGLGILMTGLMALFTLKRRESGLFRHLYRAEQQLSRSRAIMTASNDLIFVIEPATARFMDVNDAACARLGYSREEMLGMGVQDVDPLSPTGDWPQHVKEVRAKGSLIVETRHRTKDGEEIPVEVSVRFLTLGGRDCMVATARDVSERKRLERAQRRRGLRAQALFDLFGSSDQPRSELVASAVEAIVALTESRFGFLGFVDGSEATMSAHLWSNQALKDCAIDNKPVQFDLTRGGLWAAAGREHRSIIVNNFSEPHPLKNGYPEGHVHLTRFLGVPLVHAARTVLMAGLANKEDEYLEDDQLETLLFLEGFWGILRRKDAEEGLKASEQRWRQTIELAPFPIMVHAEDGHVLSVNRMWERLSGYRHEDIATVTDWAKAACGVRAADFIAAINRLYETGDITHEGEFTIRTAGGEDRIWDFSSAPLGAGEGDQRMIISMAHDITRRKQAEEELRRSRHRQETVVDSMDALVYVADMESHELLFLNKFGRDLFPDFHPGARCHDVFHAGQAGPCSFCTNDRLVDAAAFPTGICRWEYKNTKTGRWFDCRDQAIRWSDGRLVRLEIAMDITKRKRAEAKLKKLNRNLAKSNKDLELFAYVASHDLQEPLRMVSSYTQLLARRYEDKLDQDAKDFIGYAVNGANRMQRLIQDLLTYSRITTRGQPPAPFDTHVALREAVKNLQAAIQEKGALITNDDLPMVLGDHTQIVQVFQNLIGNGIKFHKPGEPPRVHVSAQPNGDESNLWTFRVTDNGIGIDPKYFQRLFVIFQRLHGKQEYPGTGIGLALCKRIVERHGGTIRVTSEPGKWTTFLFTLPSA